MVEEKKLAEFRVVIAENENLSGSIKAYNIYEDDEQKKSLIRNLLIAEVSHLLKDLISDKDNEGSNKVW